MRNIVFHLQNSLLKLSTISERSGVDMQRLEAIAKELVDPTSRELTYISKVLNLPVSYLLAINQPQKKYNLLFREGFESTAKDSVADRFGNFVEGALALSPDLNKVENIRSKIPSGENTFANAQHLSELFRIHYFNDDLVNPLDSLPAILNDLGIIIKVVKLGNQIDGASAFIDGFPFIFLTPSFEPRMLFTLAHELGHLLNHHGEGDFFYVDEAISKGDKYAKIPEERFANTFASCLLLPMRGIGLVLNKLRENTLVNEEGNIGEIELLQIMRIFNVSFDVAARRFEDLELIEKGYAFSMSEKIKAEYGSIEKRADSVGIPPRSSIEFPVASKFLLDKASVLIEQGEISLGRAADLLGIPMQEIINHRASK